MRFGDEIDDERSARLALGQRDDPEREQHKQEQEIDPDREREARRTPVQRRPVVRGGEPVGGQDGAGLGFCVAFGTLLAGAKLNRE